VWNKANSGQGPTKGKCFVEKGLWRIRYTDGHEKNKANLPLGTRGTVLRDIVGHFETGGGGLEGTVEGPQRDVAESGRSQEMGVDQHHRLPPGSAPAGSAKLRLGAAQLGEALGTLSGDQRFQPHPHQRGPLPDPRQLGGFGDQVV